MENFEHQGNVLLRPLPNSTAVLVLGILSIVATCGCIGIVGLILGIIALVLANKANLEYKTKIGTYSEVSYKNMNAGKICAIVGVCLNAITFVFIIFYMLIVGTAFSFIPWATLFNM